MADWYALLPLWLVVAPCVCVLSRRSDRGVVGVIGGDRVLLATLPCLLFGRGGGGSPTVPAPTATGSCLKNNGRLGLSVLEPGVDGEGRAAASSEARDFCRLSSNSSAASRFGEISIPLERGRGMMVTSFVSSALPVLVLYAFVVVAALLLLLNPGESSCCLLVVGLDPAKLDGIGLAAIGIRYL